MYETVSAGGTDKWFDGTKQRTGSGIACRITDTGTDGGTCSGTGTGTEDGLVHLL